MQTSSARARFYVLGFYDAQKDLKGYFEQAKSKELSTAQQWGDLHESLRRIPDTTPYLRGFRHAVYRAMSRVSFKSYLLAS